MPVKNYEELDEVHIKKRNPGHFPKLNKNYHLLSSRHCLKDFHWDFFILSW
jgi:hypothetical protein